MLALDIALLALALSLSLWLRPWRLMAGGRLLSPLLGTLVVLPWLWALPAMHAMPLQLRWSGACLVVLMMGWPLAVPALAAVGAITLALTSMGWAQTLDIIVWQGLVPATLALALGAGIRRWIGPHLFVYVLGRAFLGTVACVFAAGVLAQWTGHALPDVDAELSLVARWLMAWGDGFVTGLVAAVFVAFRPEWLVTWSDRLYLGR